jgi:hypothetical protein
MLFGYSGFGLKLCLFLIKISMVLLLESDSVSSESDEDDEDMLTVLGCESGKIIDIGLVTSMVGLRGGIC